MDIQSSCSFSSLIMPMAIALCLASFFAVGLAIISCLRRLEKLSRSPLATILVVGATSACGYLFFLIYFLSSTAGIIATLLLLVFVFTSFCLPRSRKNALEIIRLPDFWVPFILSILAGVFISSITYIGVEKRVVDVWQVDPVTSKIDFGGKQKNAVCPIYDANFVHRRTIGGSPDYLIQLLWVNGLSNDNPPWNVVLDENVARSTVADRPPLLAGVVLLFNSIVPNNLKYIYFMAMTAAASLAWMPAVWGLVRTAGLSLKRSTAFTSTVIFIYYYFMSTIYSWPKMLSGSLFVGSFILLFCRNNFLSKHPDTKQIIIGASLAGLSLLTHNSSALLLFVMALCLLMPSRWLGFKRTALGVMVCCAMILPYASLKNMHENSTSNLAKYTFTNNLIKIIPSEEYESLSTLAAMRKYYSMLSWKEILNYKLTNIREIFSPPCFLLCSESTARQSLYAEFWGILGCLKYFNVGWVIIICICVFGICKSSLSLSWSFAKPVVTDCLLVSSAGLLIFASLAFNNVNNIVSSGFVILLTVASGIPVFLLNTAMLCVFSSIIVANFVFFAVATFREEELMLSYPMLITSMVAVSGIIVLNIIIIRSRQSLSCEWPSNTLAAKPISWYKPNHPGVLR